MTDVSGIAEELRATITIKAKKIIEEAVRNDDLGGLKDDLDEMIGVYARRLRHKGIDPTTDTAWCETVRDIMATIPTVGMSPAPTYRPTPVASPVVKPAEEPSMTTKPAPNSTAMVLEPSNDAVQASIKQMAVGVFEAFNAYRGEHPNVDPTILSDFAKRAVTAAETKMTKLGLPLDNPTWAEHKERLFSTCRSISEQFEAARRAEAQAEIEAEIKRKADQAVRRAVDELDNAVEAVLGSNVQGHGMREAALDEHIASIQSNLVRLDVKADHPDWVNAKTKARENILAAPVSNNQTTPKPDKAKVFDGTVGQDVRVMLASACVVAAGVGIMIALIMV